MDDSLHSEDSLRSDYSLCSGGSLHSLRSGGSLHSLRSLLDLPDLPLLHIFSYLNIERGENLNVALVCRLFRDLTKKSVEKYKIYKHYSATFITYEKAKEVIAKYPFVRVCIYGYLGEDSRSLAPNLYRHFQMDGAGCITDKTYDEEGRFHSYNDKAAYICDDDAIKMEWYDHGKRHREGDKPAYILYYRYDFFVSCAKWYCNGVPYRENGPAVIRDDGTTEWYTDGVLTNEGAIDSGVASRIIEDYSYDYR